MRWARGPIATVAARRTSEVADPTHVSVEVGPFKAEYLRDSVVIYENGEPKLHMLEGEALMVEEVLRQLRERRERERGGA